MKKLKYIVMSILLIGVLCSCGKEEKTTEEQAVNDTQTNVIEAEEQEKTTEEKKDSNKIFSFSEDPNDYASYYGDSISKLEEKTGQSLYQDGNSYMVEGGYITTDDSGTVTEILIFCNDMMQHSYTVRGIAATDTFEEAIKKMEDASYEECVVEDVYTRLYKDDQGLLIEIIKNSDTETLVRCFSEEKYAENQASEQVSESYYLTDDVPSSTLYTSVRYAYIEKPFGEPIICINCKIQNNSPDTIMFNSSEMFSLDNAGVIETPTINDYDYKEIAAGASISTVIRFPYPMNANENFDNMTLSIEGVPVYLSDKPQSEEEKALFSGIYNRHNGKSKLMISGNGTYHVIDFGYIGSDPYITEYYDVTLDENNMFKLGEAYYLWSPDEYTIYSYDMTWEEIDEFQTPWVKN